MSLLMRKIDKSRWLQTDIRKGEDISADAITNCMKTRQNIFSVWEIKNEAEIEEAVLAIVSNSQHLETIDVVLMDSKYLGEKGILSRRSSGVTPVMDLRDRHLDLLHLSYKKLGIIAYHIVDKFINNKVKRYTKGHLKAILIEAIKNSRLKLEDLSDTIQKKL